MLTIAAAPVNVLSTQRSPQSCVKGII
jgi:hypothetical protein